MLRPTAADWPPPQAPGDETDTANAWFEPEPDPKLEPRHPTARWWSHPWTKLATLCLAAVVVVFLIVGGIRLTSRSPGSSTAPTTTATRHAPRPAQHKPFVAPIDSAQLNSFEQSAAGLQKANGVATTGFVSAGSTPTLAELTAVATSYRTALDTYNFELGFIKWPASMQTAIEVEHAQLKALVSFLQSISLVSPSGVGAWLSQLHNRTGTVQTADNQIRQDLGLPSTSSFP